MFQKMGEMFLLGLNGACAVAGFVAGGVALMAVIGFVANIIGLLAGDDKDEEG